MAGIYNSRYVLDSELGRGGMGIVYRAYDILLARPVAVKVLSGEMQEDSVKRLLREAQSAAQLNHPNIVSIYDAGAPVSEQEGDPYIVMELVEGQSLHTLRPSDPAEVVRLACQVCEALDHAHAHGIVHRDLKPENILITPNGTAKLMDFGLARSIAARLSTEGGISGSVHYIAPEQALGLDIDGRADLYALGVMIYELLTGRLPFTAEDPIAVITQHLHAPPVPPRTYRPDLPPALEAIILQLMAKQPEERPATAHEAGLALAAALPPHGANPSPEAPALLEQLGRWRLVGRHNEMAQLRGLWARARAGQASLVLLSGEPGIGKTRLAREAIVLARLQGAMVLSGGCYEYEAAAPYLPFVEALRDWVHAQTDADLKRQLGMDAAELARLAPEIESRLGPLPPNPALPPAEERLRLFDAVTRLLAGIAARSGLLFFIDDLHWADPGALSLLHYLLRRLRGERALFLAAYREIELDRAHPLAAALVEWNRERLTTRLALGRLGLPETSAMLEALFGQQTTSEFSGAIYRETEGNPFFIEEVIKALIDQGQIYRQNGQWERKEIETLAIPQSVKEAVGRRLARLNQGCINVLQTAAALGKIFEFGELAAAQGGDEESLLAALDEAASAQLVRAESGETFCFTHDKIREVLYEEMNPIRQRRLHQRVGESLEKLYVAAPGPHVQDLAHHFMHSGDLRRAIEYAVQAAEQSAQLYVHEEALRHYEQAAECAEALDQPDRLCSIYIGMSGVYRRHGSLDSAIEILEKALRLAPPGKQASLQVRLGDVYAYKGDPRALGYLQEALQTLNPQHDPDLTAQALTLMGRMYHYDLQTDTAIEYLEQARVLAEPAGNVATLTDIYTFLAGAYQLKGDMEASNEWARRTISLGHRNNLPHAEALGYEFLAENSNIINHWQEALLYAERDREIGERIGSLTRVGWAEASRTRSLLILGRLDESRAAADRSVALADHIGETRLAVFARLGRSQTLINLGEDEAAWADIEWMKTQAREVNQPQTSNWAEAGEMFYRQVRGEWEELLAMAQQFRQRTGQDNYGSLIPALAGLRRAGDLAAIAEALQPPDPGADIFAQSITCMYIGLVKQGVENAAAGLPWMDRAVAGFEQAGTPLFMARALIWRAGIRRAADDERGAAEDEERARKIRSECGAK